MITTQCLILSFTLLGSSIIVAEYVGNDPSCPSNGISYLPHYSNCSLFYECNDGFKYLMHCPEFYAFDANTDKCEVASLVDCSYTTISPPTTKPPKDPSCPATGIVNIPHYSNCTLYYTCQNGYKTLKECDPGYAWSIPLAACDFLENVDCSYTTILPPTTTPAKDPSCPDSGIKYLPNYADCYSFYECDDGYKSKIHCPDGFAWSPRVAACDFEERVDCSYTTINPPTTTPPNECPDEGYAYFPNYADCTKFYECRNGQKYDRQCPDGYAWDIILNMCDFADNVDCSYTTLAPVTFTTTNAPITPDTTCPVIGMSYIPDYADCRSYYRCKDGIKTKEVCEDGRAWSILLNMCDDEDFVDCSYTTTTLRPPTTTPFPRDCPAYGISYIPDEYDCTSFYECREGIKIGKQCPEGLAWDIDKDSCRNIDTVDCSYTKQTSPATSVVTTSSTRKPTTEFTTTPPHTTTPTSYTTEITTPITTSTMAPTTSSNTPSITTSTSPPTTPFTTQTAPLSTTPNTTPTSRTSTTTTPTQTSPSTPFTPPTTPTSTIPSTIPSSPPTTTQTATTTSPTTPTPSTPSITPTSTTPSSTPSSLPTTISSSPSTPSSTTPTFTPSTTPTSTTPTSTPSSPSTTTSTTTPTTPPTTSTSTPSTVTPSSPSTITSTTTPTTPPTTPTSPPSTATPSSQSTITSNTTPTTPITTYTSTPSTATPSSPSTITSTTAPTTPPMTPTATPSTATPSSPSTITSTTTPTTLSTSTLSTPISTTIPSSSTTTIPTSPSTLAPSTPPTSPPTPPPTLTPTITSTETTTIFTATPSTTTTETTITTKKTPGTTLDPYCPYPNKITYHIHPYDCSLYYECRDGIKYLKECQEGYLWNHVLNTCDIATDVDCSYTSVSPTGTNGLGVTPFLGAFRCKGYSDGFLLAHPFSCKKFIECKNGNDIVHACPFGTAWDKGRQYCDVSIDNKCLILSDTY